MQSFKKFKFLVVFKLGQNSGCYEPTPLKKNIILEIRTDPQMDSEIPFWDRPLFPMWLLPLYAYSFVTGKILLLSS